MNFPRNITIASLFSVISLCSCTSMSLSECQTADWERLGFQSALDGLPLSDASNKYGQLCTKKHNIAISLEPFSEGYQLGLKTYCTSQNGILEGEKLKTYKGICPKDLEMSFLTGFNVGQVTGLRNEIEHLRSQVSFLNSELSVRDAQIAALRSSMATCRHP